MAKKLCLDIVEEMIGEILIRVPVKSLLVCKSVCKQWLSIISNPSFIKSQLNHAIIASQNNPTLLTLEDGTPFADVRWIILSLDWGDDYSLSGDWEEDNPQHQRYRQLFKEALLDTNSQDLSNSPLNYDSQLVKPQLFFFMYPFPVISSYNGIICLYGSDCNRTIYLWNPSIRKCKKLPDPPRHTSLAYCMLGFGYDSISDDYKVVRFVYDLRNRVMIVQVYSTNADSWRSFREPILDNCRIYNLTNIVVNGVMYFDGGDNLVSFDLHKEVFGLVPFPSFIQRKRSHVLDFEGSVAMVFDSGPGVYLWMLDDVSGKMSWTKKFSIHDDLETKIRLYCYLGSGQFYGKKFFNEDCLLYDILYDYEKRETKYYRFGKQYVYANLKYTETLVSFDVLSMWSKVPTKPDSRKKDLQDSKHDQKLCSTWQVKRGAELLQSFFVLFFIFKRKNLMSDIYY